MSINLYPANPLTQLNIFLKMRVWAQKGSQGVVHWDLHSDSPSNHWSLVYWVSRLLQSWRTTEGNVFIERRRLNPYLFKPLDNRFNLAVVRVNTSSNSLFTGVWKEATSLAACASTSSTFISSKLDQTRRCHKGVLSGPTGELSS